MPTLTVAASVGVAWAIMTESALSFLGLGVQPPSASWGNMLTGAQTYLYSAPRLAVWPGVMILLTTLACNGLGEALRSRRR
jgi:peptide/nickel transport system permease protein